VCLGAELKSTIAVVRDGHVVMSQHLGDLKHARSHQLLKETTRDLIELFGVQPRWIAHDLHPAYLSTHHAKELSRQFGVPLIEVQHHHAHAAAVLAEYGHCDHALAIVCDGTGYGADGTIWGGELLACDLRQFSRIAHLRPMRLPGGDAAARSPWRSAMSLLHDAFGRDFAFHSACRALCEDAEQRRFIGRMIESGMSCATASSTGRLFDGIAALLGVCLENHFDAEAPMALEAAAAFAADELDAETYDLIDLIDAVDATQLDPAPLVRYIVDERRRGVPVEALAARFHHELADGWTRAAISASKSTGLKTVALSGGSMCNMLLVRLLQHRLERAGFTVLTHRDVPPNDGGIAFGQAAVAAARGVA
jgi:hydrogenase maturation protein HypF